METYHQRRNSTDCSVTCCQNIPRSSVAKNVPALPVSWPPPKSLKFYDMNNPRTNRDLILPGFRHLPNTKIPHHTSHMENHAQDQIPYQEITGTKTMVHDEKASRMHNPVSKQENRSHYRRQENTSERIDVSRPVCWRCGQHGRSRSRCHNPFVKFCSRCGTRGIFLRDCACSEN